MKPPGIQTMPGERPADLTTTETKDDSYDPKRYLATHLPQAELSGRRATNTEPAARRQAGGAHSGKGPRASTANPAKHKRSGTEDWTKCSQDA